MASRDLTVRLVGRVDAYAAAMRSASASTAGFSKQTQRNLQMVGSQMQAVGRKMTTFVTLPIVAAGALAVKSAVDWESAWAGVLKTVDGTAEQLERLEQDLRDMAKELPATHQEIAKVAETAGQLGVAVDDVAEFTRVMIDLGETTNLSAEEAAVSLARFMNIMGTSQADVGRLGSTVVDLGNNFATTEAEIVEMSTRLAAAGRQAGLSESDILAFAAALTSVGVNAEAGGTAFSKVFRTINDAVIDGGNKLEVFARVAGMSASQFATAFREDPAQAIASFIDGLGRMSTRGESTTGVLSALGLSNERVSRALLSTGQAGDVLTDALDRGETAWQENTALTEEAAKRYGTAAAQFEMVRNKIVDLFIDLGAIVLPAVEKVVDVIGILAEKFQELPRPVQIAVGGFLGLVAAMGPMIFIAGSLIKNLAQIATTMATIGPAATKASLALGAIGAAALAGFAIYQSLTEEQRRTDEVTRATAAALDIQVESLFAAADAAEETGRAIDGVAIANEALALSLAEGNNELSDALATMNIGAAETLEILALFERDPVAALERLAESFGLTEGQARRFVEAFNAFPRAVFEAGEGSEELALAVRTSTAEMDALIEATLQFEDAASTSVINDAALAFLDARIEATNYRDSLVGLAEAEVGSRHEAGNAIVVYEEWARQVAAADEETRNAAQGTGELTSAVSETADAASGAGMSFEEYAAQVHQVRFGNAKAIGQFRVLRDGTKELSGEIRTVVDVMKPAPPVVKRLSGEISDLSISADDASDEVQELANVSSDLLDELNANEAAAGRLSEAIDAVLGPTTALMDAEEEVLAAFQGVTTAIDDNGKSLDVNTEKGRANRDAVQQARDAILAHGVAMVRNGASAEDAARDIAFNTAALKAQLRQAGLTESQIEDYIETLGLTPENVKTILELEGLARSNQVIDRYNRMLDQIPEERRSLIVALIAAGQFEAADRQLDQLEADRHARVIVRADLNPFFDALNRARALAAISVAFRRTFHEGGIVPGRPGQEVPAILEAGERVIPANQVASGGGGGHFTQNVTVNMPPGSNGDDVLAALQRLQRRRGPLPLRVA